MTKEQIDALKQTFEAVLAEFVRGQKVEAQAGQLPLLQEKIETLKRHIGKQDERIADLESTSKELTRQLEIEQARHQEFASHPTIKAERLARKKAALDKLAAEVAAEETTGEPEAPA